MSLYTRTMSSPLLADRVAEVADGLVHEGRGTFDDVARTDQHVKIRRVASGQRRGCAIIEACLMRTIIVIIMNLCNFMFRIKMSGTIGTGQVNPGVSQ